MFGGDIMSKKDFLINNCFAYSITFSNIYINKNHLTSVR